jgi:hypothetical protein
LKTYPILPVEETMPISNMPIAERVARVLAAQEARRRTHAADETALSRQVDETWPQFTNNAIEVLRTLREPDASMAQAGNLVNWQSMIGAAIDGAAGTGHPQ